MMIITSVLTSGPLNGRINGRKSEEDKGKTKKTAACRAMALGIGTNRKQLWPLTLSNEDKIRKEKIVTYDDHNRDIIITVQQCRLSENAQQRIESKCLDT